MNSDNTEFLQHYNTNFTDVELEKLIRQHSSSPEVLDQHLNLIIKRLTTRIFVKEDFPSLKKRSYDMMCQLIDLRGYKRISFLSKCEFKDFVKYLNEYISMITTINIFEDWKKITVYLTVILQNFLHPLSLLHCLQARGISKDKIFSFIQHLLELLRYKGPYTSPAIEILFHIFERSEFEKQFLIDNFNTLPCNNIDLLNNFILLFAKLSKTKNYTHSLYDSIRTTILTKKNKIYTNSLIKYYNNAFSFVCKHYPNDKKEIYEYLLSTLETNEISISYKASKTLVKFSNDNNNEYDLLNKYIYSHLESKKTVSIGLLFLIAGCYRKQPYPLKGLNCTDSVINLIIYCTKEESLENRRGRLSVEKYNVRRDCAFFCLWSIFHFSSRKQLQQYKRIKDLVGSIVYSTLFDNEIKLRRAASAALQEVVGKLQDNSQFIEILQLVDFYNVGNRTRCRDFILKNIVKIDTFYFNVLFTNFLKYKQNLILEKDRCHFSNFIGRFFEIESGLSKNTESFIKEFKNKLMELLKDNKYVEEKELIKLITYLNGVCCGYRFIDKKKSRPEYISEFNKLIEEIHQILTKTSLSKLRLRGGYKKDLVKSILNIVSLNFKVNNLEVKTNIKWVEDLLNLNDITLSKDTIDVVCSFFENVETNTKLLETFITTLDSKIRVLEKLNSVKLVILYELLTTLIFRFDLPVLATSKYNEKVFAVLRNSKNITIKENLTLIIISKLQNTTKQTKCILKENNIGQLVEVLIKNNGIYITQMGKDVSGNLRVLSLNAICEIVRNYSHFVNNQKIKDWTGFIIYSYNRMVNEPFTYIVNKLDILNNNYPNLFLTSNTYAEIKKKGVLEGIIKSLSIENSVLTNSHKESLDEIFNELTEGMIVEIFDNNKKYKLGIIYVIYSAFIHSYTNINVNRVTFYLNRLLHLIHNPRLKVAVNRRMCNFMNECERFKTAIYIDYKKWVEEVNIPIINEEFNKIVK